MVGASGTVAGMTLPEAPEAGPLPATLVARTVQVTAVPLRRPDTVMGDVERDAL